METSAPRILEVSNAPLVSLVRPESATFINTTFADRTQEGMVRRLQHILTQGVRIYRAVRGGDYELLVCRCMGRFIYRRNMPAVVNALRWLMGRFIVWCVCARTKGQRLVVLDWHDESTIAPRDTALLASCDLYFKRELPQNVWTTFQRIQPPHEEYAYLPANPRFQPLAAKLRPVSLGFRRPGQVDPGKFDFGAFESLEKCHDVFFSGTWRHSTVRVTGLELLRRLRAEGVRVLLLDQHVPIEEFWKLIAQSWLVWSPEGSGWDCYRHYEVCLAGSVPLMNYPSIRRHQPLLEGIHGFYYGMEDDDLIRVARQALADKPRLSRMAQAARQHVLDHHSNVKIGEYVLRESGG